MFVFQGEDQFRMDYKGVLLHIYRKLFKGAKLNKSLFFAGKVAGIIDFKIFNEQCSIQDCDW